ncbi:MAG: carboxypeptidase regulatory-like domain-containing protein [Acidobacteria bacterium]|nr:carboxypeptidase regulatory-like domain-containing protein [Acidobacteriota bacterium]
MAAPAEHAAAQGVSSSVTGTVRDTSGAVVPGATVTLINDDTDVAFVQASSSAGAYTFEAVPSGLYSVRVELDGFKAFLSTGNRVAVGEPTTINAVLEPGALTDTVEVTASAQTVQVSSSGNLGTVVDQRTIEAMPIVGGRGRNPLDLVKIQPGVVSGANTGGGTHVHGARDRSWNFTLDGIDINETSAGGSNFSPLRTNPDAIAEFKVLTGSFTAEFGRNSGGQVAMVTRQGTNQFKGTGFYLLRRPNLNANEWENNIDSIGKRQEELDIAGFSLGGPLRRGQTFFFTNLQTLTGTRTLNQTRTVYTEAARRGLWRYVVNGRNFPAGTANASVDANGNVLPGVPIGTYNIAASDPDRIGLNPVTAALIGSTPLPNNFSVGDGLNTAGYTWQPEEREKQLDILARVDHAFNNRHNVFARVAWGRQDTLCDGVNGGLAVFPGTPCLVDTKRNPLNGAVSWRASLGSRLVNEFVVGRNQFAFDFVSLLAEPNRLSFTGTRISLPEDYTLGNLRRLSTWQVVNNTTYVRGTHTVKGGVNVRYQRHEDVRGSVAGANVNPQANFATGVNVVDTVRFGLPTNMNIAVDQVNIQQDINFLLGRIGSLSQGFVSQGTAYAPGGTPFVFDARFPEIDLYLQDNWKLRPNLTIDAGLRWEMKLNPRNPEGLIRRPSQRVAAGEPATNALTWVDQPLYSNDLDNLAPSLGFAWDPGGDGTSVVRGNYRVAYDRINTFLLSSSIFQSIPGITAAVANVEYGQGGGRIGGQPSLQPTATPDAFLAPAPVGNASIRVMDTTFESPLTHGWSVGYQREVWSRTVLEANYVGRRASGLFGAYDANQVDIRGNGFLDAFNTVRNGGQSALINQLMAPDTRRGANETGSDAMRRLFPSELTLNSVAAVAANLATRVQGGRQLTTLAGLSPYFFSAYPQFLGGMIVVDSNDWSRYHGLELTLQRRFGGGFGYLLGYTLSKSNDTRSYDPAFTVVSTGAAQSASSTPFDINNRSLNYAPSDFDRRHVLQASVVSELPIGHGRRWGANLPRVLDAIVGGWEAATIVVWQAGRPLTVYAGANTLSNVVQTPANCEACSGTLGEVFDDVTGVKFFFDDAARARFSGPAAGEFSNVGRNYFVGPPGFNVDLAVSKRFRVVGTHAIDVRADVTNLTNTPTFGFPTTTLTAATFGRIRNSVASLSRKVQVGLRYSF